ncbi:MAG: hypothetical protein CMO20_02130 [Thermoplasmata archaeon]|nr:hypothetical protein [Thermoplasmata archaeon]
MDRVDSGNKAISATQLQAIENQLFSLVRQQAKRNHPIDLPRPDFWSQVSLLLASIDNELADVGRNEGWSVKAQNLSRRQGNVRRAVADLTQHRLTSFVRHAATNNLALAPLGDALTDSTSSLTPLDWQRHDASERAFYEGLGDLIEKYKHQVSWNVLQEGILAAENQAPIVEPGTTQLDEFVKDEGGITGDGPPKIIVKEPEIQPYVDPDDIDEEDRIAKMNAYPTSGIIKPDVNLVNTSINSNKDENHVDENNDSKDMIRIKMLQDLPAPIIDSNGNELDLMTGDVEFCDSVLATGLIAAGLAESL